MADRKLDLASLRVFDAVARLGSFTAAAGELGLSQPAVSYQIRRIEDEIGTKLLRRLHRGVALSDAGQRLHRAARAGIEGIDDAVRDIRRRSRTPAVRIYTDYGFAALWLMPRVADFRKLHPEVEVHVVASQDLDPELEETADVAVLFGERGDFRAGARLLMPERVVPVCSPGFVARRGPFSDVASLPAQPLLHLDTIGRARWFTWSTWLATQGLSREPAQGDLGLNTYGFVIQAALAEQGIALGWIGLVDAHLASGTLVAVGPEVARENCGYWLVTSPSATPAVNALSDWLMGREATAGSPRR